MNSLRIKAVAYGVAEICTHCFVSKINRPEPARRKNRAGRFAAGASRFAHDRYPQMHEPQVDRMRQFAWPAAPRAWGFAFIRVPPHPFRYSLTAADARCSDSANCCAMSARQKSFDAGNRATVNSSSTLPP
jgi:hypothetical protein